MIRVHSCSFVVQRSVKQSSRQSLQLVRNKPLAENAEDAEPSGQVYVALRRATAASGKARRAIRQVNAPFLQPPSFQIRPNLRAKYHRASPSAHSSESQ